MSPILNSELHLHLYGCLTAEDVFEMGREVWRDREDALRWFAFEYEKVYQRKPEWEAYWGKGNNGFELLKEDFEFLTPAPFPCFQARFNLMIALFPIVPGDTKILKKVLLRHLEQGLEYAEYRTILPARLNEQESFAYLTAMMRDTVAIENSSGGRFTPRVALSLSRDNHILLKQYATVKSWMKQNPSLSGALSGIDFCGFEEGYPPSHKRDFFQLVHNDNLAHPRDALALLYHVGESFETMSLASAARWVYEAASYGAQRLGHAIALGINPYMLLGKQIREDIWEHQEHLGWLKANISWLNDLGAGLSLDTIDKELAFLSSSPEKSVTITYTPELCEGIRCLQDALLRKIATLPVVIESCPTSNYRIGRIPDAKHHPLPRFLAHGVSTVVSTDDPGIFAINLNTEEKLLINDFALEAADICGFQQLANHSKSEIMTKRY